MIAPPVWQDAELERDRHRAIAAFREERMRESRQKYLAAFDDCLPTFQDVIERLLMTDDPMGLPDAAVLDVIADARRLEALRYLAAPPMSADDLKTLADVSSLAPGSLRRNARQARLVYQTVLQGIDVRRFPWVGKRRPTDDDVTAAARSSAALLAGQQTETARRSEGKTAQEASVCAALDAEGLRGTAPRSIQTLDAAPAPGEYCGESMLGGRKADIVVRLWDLRVLAIECKVSNSATNSIKRLNNDAAVKAGQWLKEFGVRQMVPSAALSGVFKLRNLVDAQKANLTLWWAHDLGQLRAWIASTRASR